MNNVPLFYSKLEEKSLLSIIKTWHKSFNVKKIDLTPETHMKYLKGKNPEIFDLLERTNSLSVVARTPFLAQLKRKETPILEDEIVPTLLSEDLDTIAVIGLASRSFPDFHPSEADIIKHLDASVCQGFDKEHAQQIMIAWNKIPPVQITQPEC